MGRLIRAASPLTVALLSVAVLSVTLVPLGIGPAADPDDRAWIRRCISDNRDEGQTSVTVAAYCKCMNNQMSSSETLSITAWEKTHKREADACGKSAGWVGR